MVLVHSICPSLPPSQPIASTPDEESPPKNSHALRARQYPYLLNPNLNPSTSLQRTATHCAQDPSAQDPYFLNSNLNPKPLSPGRLLPKP
jgi:hypothetical protein